MSDEHTAGQDELAGTESTETAGNGDAAVQDTTPAAPDDGAIQAELGRLQEEVERLRELYLRKLAEFENSRKRQEREMADFRRFANSDLLRDLLPVVDNLERALEAPGGGGDGLRTGVELVLRQLKDVLTRHGLVEVSPMGDVFDPAVHEAIQRVPSHDVEENTVVQVFQKGYLLGERLLRPALVVVAVPDDGPGGGGDTVGS